MKKLPTRDDRDIERENLAAIAVAIILVVGVVILVQVIKSHVLLQNCNMAGFIHCRWPLFPHINW